MTAEALGRDVRLTACPDGPLLARGAETVVDQDGRHHEVDRPVVALCTCDRSGLRPFCDSTHKYLRRSAS